MVLLHIIEIGLLHVSGDVTPDCLVAFSAVAVTLEIY